MTAIDDEAVQMIADCEARESRLSDWARGFLDSLSQQLARGRDLSSRQLEKLAEIWEAATKDG